MPTRVATGDPAAARPQLRPRRRPTEDTTVADWDGRHPNYAMIIDLLLAVDGHLDYNPPDNGNNN